MGFIKQTGIGMLQRKKKTAIGKPKSVAKLLCLSGRQSQRLFPEEKWNQIVLLTSRSSSKRFLPP